MRRVGLLAVMLLLLGGGIAAVLAQAPWVGCQYLTAGSGVTVLCPDALGRGGATISAAGGSGAPATASYWTATSESALSNETNLGALTTGLILNTVTAGTAVPTAYAGTTCTNQFPRSLDASGAATCATVANTDLANASFTLNGSTVSLGGSKTLTLASADFANQGTTATVLHGHAAGNPSFGAVVSADLNLTPTTCTNQFLTALSAGGVGTCTTTTLAGAQFANQGTTATVLHGNAAGNPSFGAVVSGDLSLTTTSCTNQFVSAISAGGVGTCTPSTLAGAQHANQGTTVTVLHGNAAGNPSFAAVVSADLSLTTTSCTNQFVTAISAGGVGTCTTATLAGAQHANQGTTIQVLHGNAAGNPSWSPVSLTADVTGVLPVANGGAATTTTYTPALSAAGTIVASSLTVRHVTYFVLPAAITLNQLAVYFTAVTTAGTLKVCLYSADGATRYLDGVLTPVAATVVAASASAVALAPGGYYFVTGCATTCSVTLLAYAAETGGLLLGVNVGSKKPWHGTVTHTSATCNTALGTVTGANQAAPAFRLDT